MRAAGRAAPQSPPSHFGRVGSQVDLNGPWDVRLLHVDGGEGQEVGSINALDSFLEISLDMSWYTMVEGHGSGSRRVMVAHGSGSGG